MAFGLLVGFEHRPLLASSTQPLCKAKLRHKCKTTAAHRMHSATCCCYCCLGSLWFRVQQLGQVAKDLGGPVLVQQLLQHSPAGL